MTAVLADVVDTIADLLHERDLDGARAAFDAAVQGPENVVDEMVRALAATVVIPPAMTVWGFGLDVWANPYRDPGERAWRCGGCRMTGSHFTSDRAARRSAEEHVAEVHGGRLAVVSYLDEAYWAAVEAAF